MKILYISPENTVGTLSLWKKEHISNNHICRTITFFRSPKGFKDDICLELPFNFTRPQLAMIRHNIYKFYYQTKGRIIVAGKVIIKRKTAIPRCGLRMVC